MSSKCWNELCDFISSGSSKLIRLYENRYFILYKWEILGKYFTGISYKKKPYTIVWETGKYNNIKWIRYTDGRKRKNIDYWETYNKGEIEMDSKIRDLIMVEEL